MGIGYIFATRTGKVKQDDAAAVFSFFLLSRAAERRAQTFDRAADNDDMPPIDSMFPRRFYSIVCTAFVSARRKRAWSDAIITVYTRTLVTDI